VPDYVTINRNSDFRRIYNRGISSADPALVIYLMKNRAGICRIGITSSKKIGNAVQRNRSRRIIRAAFDELYRQDPARFCGYDIVFVARTKTRFRKSTQIKDIIDHGFEKSSKAKRQIS
jgi:ribonuclease P protein component